MSDSVWVAARYLGQEGNAGRGRRHPAGLARRDPSAPLASVTLHELERPPPCVVARGGVLVVVPIEERVWGAGVDLNLVLDFGADEA